MAKTDEISEALRAKSRGNLLCRSSAGYAGRVSGGAKRNTAEANNKPAVANPGSTEGFAEARAMAGRLAIVSRHSSFGAKVVHPRGIRLRRASARQEPRDTLAKARRKIAQYKPELESGFQVKEIGIFGSYVRGEQTKNSDLDVLVEFKEAPGLFKFLELEERLKTILNVKVDLVMKSALKPLIGKRILSEVIYA